MSDTDQRPIDLRNVTAIKSAVWKWTIPDIGPFTLDMPFGAQVLTVQMQHGAATLWALVEPGASEDKRHFLIVGTGHSFDASGLRYVGTFQVAHGALVWHLWERADV